MTICGEKLAFGIKPEWGHCEIENVPIGGHVVLRRIRAGEPMTVFVKSSETISKHHLALTPKGLKILSTNGANVREDN